jgi:hypothetical protein
LLRGESSSSFVGEASDPQNGNPRRIQRDDQRNLNGELAKWQAYPLSQKIYRGPESSLDRHDFISGHRELNRQLIVVQVALLEVLGNAHA